MYNGSLITQGVKFGVKSELKSNLTPNHHSLSALVYISNRT